MDEDRQLHVISKRRWGKPTNEYKSQLRRANRDDFLLLLRACLSALIAGEKDVLVAFGYTMKFPKGFPKGVLEKKDGLVNIRRIKAAKLLDWLREKGITDVTVDTIRSQKIAFAHFENRVEEMIGND